MIRLGVAARVLGAPYLRSQASTCLPGSETAHLSRGLLHLRSTLAYLSAQRIRCFRLPDTLLPLVPGAEPRDTAAALEAVSDLCAEVGTQAQGYGIRLSLHPGLHLQLASPNHAASNQAVAALSLYAALLDMLGCGPETVIVLHVGGAYGQHNQAMERFAAAYEQLPELVRRRIVVEADEHCFDIATLLWLGRVCGVPLVFDSLHFQLHNPQGLPASEGLALAVATWPAGVRPKIHFSSQRTEAHLREAKGGAAQIVAPRRGQHADFINPFEFAALLRSARALPPFDVMLEAKAADLALQRLREDLHDLAPDVAAQVE